MGRLVIGLLLVVILTTGLLAQTAGKIAGTVTDAATNEPLVGVNVVIENTYLGAATDIEGKYFILNVPPGTYRVKFMLMGYQSKTVEGVDVSVNRTRTLDVKLQQTTLELGGEVVVTADRITVKKDQTSSIRNVSSEQMSVLPVENTG
ncbi:MAG: carboxypeptidase-like regulatory domain-containing protein, partial [candidate division KSB1 bacterium]|nr:carboxypeptidase-like regulatory domain-containing protein [candidate division KSB1 bacterium]